MYIARILYPVEVLGPGKRIGKNIYLDIGEEELLCIAFVPRVNDSIVREAIMGTGYNIEEWLKE